MVIKLGVPLAVVIPLRSTGKAPPGAAGAKKKDLKFPSYPDHSEALLKLRPILTIGISRPQQYPIKRPIEEAFFANGDQQLRFVSTLVFLVLS